MNTNYTMWMYAGILCLIFSAAVRADSTEQSSTESAIKVVRQDHKYVSYLGDVGARQPDPNYMPPGCDLYYRVVLYDRMPQEYVYVTIFELFGPRWRYIEIDENTGRMEGETKLTYRIVHYRRSMLETDADGNYIYVKVYEDQGDFPKHQAWFHLLLQTRVFQLPKSTDNRTDNLYLYGGIPGPWVFFERNTPERYENLGMSVPPLGPAFPILRYLVDRFPKAPIWDRIQPNSPPLDPELKVAQPMSTEELIARERHRVSEDRHGPDRWSPSKPGMTEW